MAEIITIPEAADHLTSHFGCDVPAWKVRRVVDALDIDIPRIGNTRLIPRTLLNQLAESLRPWVAAHRESPRCSK